MDHENFDGALTGECSPWDAKRLACALVGEKAPRGAVAAFIANVGAAYVDWDRLSDDFMDAFCGVFESSADFAADLAVECGLLPQDTGAWPTSCIDWARAWDELRQAGDYWSSPATATSGVFVFRTS